MEGKVNFYEQRTIKWDEKKNSVTMIDQTLLPANLSFVECTNVSQIIDAIKTMKIRGAPAIGVAGAMGVVLSVFSSASKTKKSLLRDIGPDVIALRDARPTAINLAWGVDKSVHYLENNLPEEFEAKLPRKMLVEFVQSLADSDVETNKKLSSFGAMLFRSGDSVLTHCN